MWQMTGNFAFCHKENGPKRILIDIKRCDYLGNTSAAIVNNDPRLEPTELHSTVVTLHNGASTNQVAHVSTNQITENLSAPFLTGIPDSLVRAPAGSSVSWACEAVGSPPPSIKWLKGNMVLSKAGTLTINSLRPEDEGTYGCVATNDAGVAAREVKLYVIGGLLEDEHYSRYIK